jgi:alkaline phosphatase D
MPPTPLEVEWVVARDEQCHDVVRRGRAVAEPRWAHSVHVEVDGLQPDRWYFYQFRFGDHASAVGRTRTLPSRGARVDRLRFAFACCQHYEMGYFTPFRHMAAEELDLVFHLGDYIYETGTSDRYVRRHVGPALTTLEHYRNRHAQYKTDPDLQAAHARFPWIVTWDDHEVVNDYAADTTPRRDPPEQFLLRRAAAYQAYYEHMPLRAAAIPAGPSLTLYRGFAYGGLASFFVLDTRQYRTVQACGNGVRPACDTENRHLDPKGTLMGPAQERWLHDGLERSKARWNVLPQQVMMAKMDWSPEPDVRFSYDQWDGYERERARLLSLLARRRVANPVVLAGDVHNNWVNDVLLDFDDPLSPVVASELVATSISTNGDGGDVMRTGEIVVAKNRFVKFHDDHRGYVSCDLTKDALRADFQIVPYVTRAGAPRQTKAVFRIGNGRAGAVRVT